MLMSPASAYYLPNDGPLKFRACEQKFTPEQIKQLGYDLEDEYDYKCYYHQPDSKHYVFVDYTRYVGNAGCGVYLYTTELKREEFEDGIVHIHCENWDGEDLVCYKAINRFVFYPTNDPQFNKYPHPYLHYSERGHYLFANLDADCVKNDDCRVFNLEEKDRKFEFGYPFPSWRCIMVPESENFICFLSSDYEKEKYLNMSRAELEKEFPDIKYGWGNPENAKKEEYL